MKIAFIVGAFPKLSETFILNQITGLLDLGHDVDIFAQFNPEEEKVHQDVETYHLMEQVHYFDMPSNRLRRVLKAVYLLAVTFHKAPLAILKSFNIFKYGTQALSLRLFYIFLSFIKERDTYDIIHCHFGPNGIIGVQLKELGMKGKIVTTFHGYDVNSYPKIAGEDVYSDLFKGGDLFTANTSFTKQQIVRLGGHENKIVILPVGLRIERFTFSERKIQPRGTINILTVGRLVEKKGHEYAIRAIAKVVAKHENILYTIAGDGDLRSELESLALELRIKEYVNFLGVATQNEVIKLYEQSHIFVLPSITASNGDREGQGLVLQEAQATGLPVVSTYHNGIPEGVVDGKSGFLAPEKDVDALAEKIEHLIEHPERWPEMGQFGRKFVEENYDIKKLNRKLVKIYEECLAK